MKPWQQLLGVWILIGIAVAAFLAPDPRQRWVLVGSAAAAAVLWSVAIFRSGLTWDQKYRSSPVVEAMRAGVGMAVAFLLTALLQPGVRGWVRFSQLVVVILGFTAGRIIVTAEFRRMRSRSAPVEESFPGARSEAPPHR